MLQSDWLRYSISIRQYISSSGEERDKAEFFVKKQCLLLVFSDNFEEHKFVSTKTIRLLALNFYMKR